MFKQYQIIELKEDLNPVIKKGMEGVILEVWDKNNFEVEFLDAEGVNIQYNDEATFTVNAKLIKQATFNPPPRSFEQWCADLGFRAEGNCPPKDTVLNYSDFISYPNVVYYKVKETQLYSSERYYGEQGQNRTAKEFLEDLNMILESPTEEDLKALNRIFEYDEFWRWSSGKVYYKDDNKHRNFWQLIKSIFKKN